MLNSKKLLLAAAVSSIAAVTQAATINVTPVVKGYWPSGSDIYAVAPVPAPANNAAAGIYQIDVLVSTTLDTADTAGGFGGLSQLSFDIAFGGAGLSANGDLTYTPYDPKRNNANTRVSYSSPFDGSLNTAGSGAAATAAIFSDGGDIGPSSTDLKFIYAEVSGSGLAAGDARRGITTPQQNALLTQLLGNPLAIGTFAVNFAGGTNTAELTAGFLSPGEGYNLLNADSGAQSPNSTSGATFGAVAFGGEIPEPATLSLAALGGLGLIRRRRA